MIRVRTAFGCLMAGVWFICLAPFAFFWPEKVRAYLRREFEAAISKPR